MHQPLVPEFPLSQPLVFAVGHLGPQYWAWVDRPVPGRPRFFGPSALEHCSKTAWWVVPALWLPVWAAATAAAVKLGGADGTAVAALVAQQLVGIVLWQALEYSIHRFLFHARSTSYWGITLHFLFHGCHHKFPMDAERLVFPPLPAAPIVAAVFGVLRLLLPPLTALGVMAGVLLGYVAYDCLHYGIHHNAARLAKWPLLRELCVRHNHHHYKDHDAGYGISSVAFDVLLRTSAALAAGRPA